LIFFLIQKVLELNFKKDTTAMKKTKGKSTKRGKRKIEKKMQ